MQKGNSYIEEYIITEEIYRGFINVFSDRNPLHTDRSFALQHGMKDVVMHGNILNGFISHFIGEVLPEKNVIIHSQEINFYLPVFLNDRLTLSAEISEVHDAVKVFLFKYIFRNSEEKRIAKGIIQIGLI